MKLTSWNACDVMDGYISPSHLLAPQFAASGPKDQMKPISSVDSKPDMSKPDMMTPVQVNLNFIIYNSKIVFDLVCAREPGRSDSYTYIEVSF